MSESHKKSMKYWKKRFFGGGGGKIKIKYETKKKKKTIKQNREKTNRTLARI